MCLHGAPASIHGGVGHSFYILGTESLNQQVPASVHVLATAAKAEFQFARGRLNDGASAFATFLPKVRPFVEIFFGDTVLLG